MGTVRMVNGQGQVRHFTEAVANHPITKRNGWYRQDLEPLPEGGIAKVIYVPSEVLPDLNIDDTAITISPAAQEAKTYIDATPATPKPKPKRKASGKKAAARKPSEKKK